MITIVIWAYCPTCWTQTEQTFEKEEGIYEYYRCTNCKQLHKVAVR